MIDKGGYFEVSGGDVGGFLIAFMVMLIFLMSAGAYAHGGGVKGEGK